MDTHLRRGKEEESRRRKEEEEGQICDLKRFLIFWFVCLFVVHCLLRRSPEGHLRPEGEEMSRNAAPVSLFTGGAWFHAPPVVVARQPTRHQPSCQCTNCSSTVPKVFYVFFFMFMYFI